MISNQFFSENICTRGDSELSWRSWRSWKSWRPFCLVPSFFTGRAEGQDVLTWSNFCLHSRATRQPSCVPVGKDTKSAAVKHLNGGMTTWIDRGTSDTQETSWYWSSDLICKRLLKLFSWDDDAHVQKHSFMPTRRPKEHLTGSRCSSEGSTGNYGHLLIADAGSTGVIGYKVSNQITALFTQDTSVCCRFSGREEAPAETSGERKQQHSSTIERNLTLQMWRCF